MRSSLILLCLIAGNGCGRLSASNAGTQGQAAAPEATGKGISGASNDGVLRDSYYACAKSSDGSTGSIQRCIETEFAYQDGRLNSTYRYLLGSLPAAEGLVLRNDERRWLSAKEASCKWDPDSEGQAQRINANVCSLKKTAERAGELEKKFSALVRQ
jgi:uncharacterized protein YecT (DUF1311 family)